MTTTQTACPTHPDSPADLADHVGNLPCVVAVQNPTPRGLYDLPMFGWAWAADAAEVER